MRLMLVEDNERLAGFVMKGLRAAGFAVVLVATGKDARAALAAATYDAMILDLGLPDVDGLVLLKKIRAEGKTLPILILTARDGLDDRIKGLDAGADDYVLKPFMIDEVAARMRALLRRPSNSLHPTLSLGNLVLDTSNRDLRVNDKGVALPRRELALLEQLMRRAGRVIPRGALEENIYGFDDEISPNSLEVVMSRLRKALRQADANIEITTYRNVGYMLSAGP